MKKTAFKISALASVILLMQTAIFTTSCKKSKECHGDVTVIDTNDRPLAGATVRLFHPGDTSQTYVSKPGNIVYSGVTDAQGKVSFELKLPAVMQVRVDHPKIKGMYKIGVLILNEPGSSDSETIHF